MRIDKEISEHNEFYLYMNGKLIYKKWLDTGQSKVFDLMVYDKYTHESYTDLDVKNSSFIIEVAANVRFLTAQEGGRSQPISSGYRPNHVFEYNAHDQLLEAYPGELKFQHVDQLALGVDNKVIVRFISTPRLEQYLEKGRKWYLHEGPNLVGHAEIVSFL